ncbi:MAG: hypothetical protein HYV29_01790 [Ignavibacteriales bacterium]|nr:hypothetical protein [Ignavibacteriales bacterium]
MKVRNVVALAGIVFIVSQIGFSQNNEEQQSAKLPVKPDAWGMQFRIGPNLSLGSFNGMMVSLKKHISETSALRIGIGVEFYDRDMTEDLMDYRADSLIAKRWYDNTNNSTFITVVSQYVWMFPSGNSVDFFIACGPTIGYEVYDNDDKAREETIPNTETSIDYSTEYTSWLYGMTNSIGVEWFASKDLSLHAEYEASLVYTTVERKTEVLNTINNPDSKSFQKLHQHAWRLENNLVKFGLTVYF